MALKVNYRAALSEAHQDVLKVERAMLNRMIREAEAFVTNARLAVNIDSGSFPKGDYTDQTKNLRNSIGYVIYKDGVSIRENIEVGGEGSSAARLALAQVPSKAGYVLVGIAGMNYASYLESLGYNVITSQGMLLIQDLYKSLKKLEKKTPGEINVLSQGVSGRL